MKVPGMNLVAAAIVKSGPEIKNHCSAIVPASRTAQSATATATIPTEISSVIRSALKSAIICLT